MSDEDEPNDDQGDPSIQMTQTMLDSAAEKDNQNDESMESYDQTEVFDEKKEMESFEKRILYLLLTLQTMFYVSEAAIDFVASSLAELFLTIPMHKLVGLFHKFIRLINVFLRTLNPWQFVSIN